MLRAVAVLAFIAAGCGDNIRPDDTTVQEPGRGGASVGGGQVARSKSFLLVTSVATSPQHKSTSTSFNLRSGLGAQ